MRHFGENLQPSVTSNLFSVYYRVEVKCVYSGAFQNSLTATLPLTIIPSKLTSFQSLQKPSKWNPQSFSTKKIELFSERDDIEETKEEIYSDEGDEREERLLVPPPVSKIHFNLKSSTTSSALSYEINHSSENTPNKDEDSGYSPP